MEVEDMSEESLKKFMKRKFRIECTLPEVEYIDLANANWGEENEGDPFIQGEEHKIVEIGENDNYIYFLKTYTTLEPTLFRMKKDD